MFILSNNGKVGVYGNGDRVYGSGGTEKALIMTGATNVVVENTVEEIHVANNMEQLTFSVDTNTNEVHVLSGTTTLAVFAPNAAGIKLFTANGMSVIKSVVDTATGDISFTADNGATGATAIPLPTDATALPADAIDASQKSENAGGVNPEPTPTVKEFSIAEYTAAVAAGNLPDAYALNDTAANLAGATYAAVTGASSITLEDNLSDLFKADGTLSAAATTAAALATKVVVADSLNNLLSATLPTGGIGGKPTSLLVTGKVNSSVVLDDITVAKAATAQADLDAFLTRTDVAYDADSGAKKPDALKLSSYSITDDAAAVAAANADATQKALLTAAEKVDISDTMKGISSVPVDTFNLISLGKTQGSITVDDSLAAFSEAKPTETILKALKGANATFAVTDTGDVAEVDIAGLLNFASIKDTTSKGAILLDSDVTSISLSAEGMKAAPSGNTLTVDVDKDLFNTDAFTGKINITGSKFNDSITASAKGGTIDGGLGADTIILAASNKVVDTVVLGTGITTASDYGTDSANVDTISNFETGATGDKLDFDGFLSAFDELMDASMAATNGGANDIAGKIAIGKSISAAAALNASDVAAFFASGANDSKLLKLDAGKDAVVIDTKGGVWYVANDGDMQVTEDEVFLVATLDKVDGSTLTADNFA